MGHRLKDATKSLATRFSGLWKPAQPRLEEDSLHECWSQLLMNTPLEVPADGWLDSILGDPSVSAAMLDEFRVVKAHHVKCRVSPREEPRQELLVVAPRHELVVVMLESRSAGPKHRHYLRTEWRQVPEGREEEAASGQSSERPETLINLDSSSSSSSLSTPSSGAANRREPSVRTIAVHHYNALTEENGSYVQLNEMTFPNRTDRPRPTLLDLAIVVHAHADSSKACAIPHTEGFWYAGSAYQVLEEVYHGRSKKRAGAYQRGFWPVYTLLKQYLAGPSEMIAAEINESMGKTTAEVSLEWLPELDAFEKEEGNLGPTSMLKITTKEQARVHEALAQRTVREKKEAEEAKAPTRGMLKKRRNR